VRHAAKVVAISGGASGIGFAFAQRWIAEGGTTVLLDINGEGVRSAVETLDAQWARGVVCDITHRASVEAAIASIADHERQLDALVNGAGIVEAVPAAEISDEQFAHLVDIHVFGTLRASRAAYPMLKATQGSIVNISSVAAVMGLPKRASYGAAKAGIEGLTRTLAVEWAPDGVRVNAVAPGYTRTSMTERMIGQGKLNVGPIEARTPLGRFAQPSEIAAAISFLLCAEASFITGQTLTVDGGLTIGGNWF
jgi:NAD(P)-dependent dehydrogenase (short-subunit alcohol dehydrogenase family)